MIKPTVGRVVWYHADRFAQTMAAIVSYVASDGRINIAFFDLNGVAGNRTSVRLVQDGEPAPGGEYCEWMPYQKGQAAKTEALEARLKNDVDPVDNP